MVDYLYSEFISFLQDLEFQDFLSVNLQELSPLSIEGYSEFSYVDCQSSAPHEVYSTRQVSAEYDCLYRYDSQITCDFFSGELTVLLEGWHLLNFAYSSLITVFTSGRELFFSFYNVFFLVLTVPFSAYFTGGFPYSQTSYFDYTYSPTLGNNQGSLPATQVRMIVPFLNPFRYISFIWGAWQGAYGSPFSFLNSLARALFNFGPEGINVHLDDYAENYGVFGRSAGHYSPFGPLAEAFIVFFYTMFTGFRGAALTVNAALINSIRFILPRPFALGIASSVLGVSSYVILWTESLFMLYLNSSFGFNCFLAALVPFCISLPSFVELFCYTEFLIPPYYGASSTSSTLLRFLSSYPPSLFFAFFLELPTFSAELLRLPSDFFSANSPSFSFGRFFDSIWSLRTGTRIYLHNAMSYYTDSEGGDPRVDNSADSVEPLFEVNNPASFYDFAFSFPYQSATYLSLSMGFLATIVYFFSLNL